MAASWRIRDTGRRAALRDVAAGLALTAAASGCTSAPPASAPAVARPPARIDGPVDSLIRGGTVYIGSALVYAPGTYASTQELIALCQAAAEYRGLYASHLRFEDARLIEGVDELIRIAREAGLPAEIHHFKAAGRGNWPLLDQAIDRIERARREGLQITANVYLYTASGAGVIARIPAWAHDGGTARLFERLRDSATRGRLIAEMSRQNFDNIVLVRFRSPALKPLAGQRLVDIARVRGRPPVETLLDLVAEDRSRIDAIFLDVASEDNLRRALQRPRVSICSDGASLSNDDDDEPVHPRSYGNFARFLGRYVREQRILALPEAIRRMTGLPASNLGLDRRGLLKEGFFADVVVFDPRTIADRATYQEPRKFSVGVQHVLVNGVPVLKDGQHTGALPGRALRGRGATIRGGPV